ncbi:MAG: hypothetical protein JRJ87_18445 [Deltaproteobacteria bacterium]|nr:hypothetical protein [Deltaproteobacteria bacterium]
MSLRAFSVATILFFVLGSQAPAAGEPEEENEEDYSFDATAFEKKAHEWGGFFELKGTQLILDKDASLFDPNSLSGDGDSLLHQVSGVLDLHTKLHKDPVTAHAHLRAQTETGERGFAKSLHLFRLSLAAQPCSILSFEVGKTLVRWGKGYAFNPVAFIDRPKDPSDPDEALEGFFLAQLELTKSFDGPLRTLSATLVVLPVHEDVNEDFGRPGHENFAARISMLLFDADIDLMVLSGGSRSVRYGLDFAYNLSSNFEMHAEATFGPDVPVPLLAAGQLARLEKRASLQALGGLRYLSPQDTTYILEYYYNGAGASPEQIGLFYDSPTPDPGAAPVEIAALNLFRTPFPMRHYLYVRVSQKEPFEVLNFFPALFAIINLEDGSFNLTPELLYKGITNLELRLRGSMIFGTSKSDFGERPNDGRIEIRARYFF